MINERNRVSFSLYFVVKVFRKILVANVAYISWSHRGSQVASDMHTTRFRGKCAIGEVDSLAE